MHINYFYPYFVDERTEAQRVYVIASKITELKSGRVAIGFTYHTTWILCVMITGFVLVQRQKDLDDSKVLTFTFMGLYSSPLLSSPGFVIQAG